MSVIRIDNTTTNIGDTMKIGDLIKHKGNGNRYLIVSESLLDWILVPIRGNPKDRLFASKVSLTKTTKGFEVITESR